MAASRPRQKRRTGDQFSKLSDKLAGLAGKKCIASYIRDEHGDVFMILMADGCPACLEAKGQLRERERSRAASDAEACSRAPGAVLPAGQSAPDTSGDPLDRAVVRAVPGGRAPADAGRGATSAENGRLLNL
jgi:hypothetical protein